MHAKPTIILDEIHTESFSKNIIKDQLHKKIEKLEIKLNKIETSLNNFYEINQIESNKETLNRIERLERNLLTNSNLKSRNLKKDYKTPVKEILANTSLQFLSSPMRSKRFLIKIINSSFLILSMCLTIYLLVKNITEYLMYDTTTSITTIYENKPEFPVVSFCPMINSDVNKIEIRFNNENLTTEWENYFEVFQDSTLRLKCYRFNSGFNMSNHSVLIKKSIISGHDNGFDLEFKSNATSFLVSIYNQSQKPSTIFDKGYYISPGSRNYFSIKRINDKKLEDPFNDCFNDVSKFTRNKYIIDYMKNKTWDYSKKECTHLCENLKYLEDSNCNCSLNYLDEYLSRVCYENSNDKNKACYNTFMDHFHNDHDIDQICSEYCPLECDTFNYDISINSRFILDMYWLRYSFFTKYS
jgi:hypothetical protein